MWHGRVVVVHKTCRSVSRHAHTIGSVVLAHRQLCQGPPFWMRLILVILFFSFPLHLYLDLNLHLSLPCISISFSTSIFIPLSSPFTPFRLPRSSRSPSLCLCASLFLCVALRSAKVRVCVYTCEVSMKQRAMNFGYFVVFECSAYVR